MAAQQATATEFFDISMDPPSVVVEEPMEVEVETPAPMQTVEVKTQRVRRKVKRSMEVDRLDDDETAGTKRPPPESVEERMRKAARGDEIINNFHIYLKNSGWTVPMIKHQLIMHGVEFDPDATRKDLEMIIASEIASEEPTKFKNQEPDTEIKKRLKTWKDKHGFLPLENIKENPKNKAKAKQQSSAGASSSNEPRKLLVPELVPEPVLSDGSNSDEDIPKYQQPPIRKKPSITNLREFLARAYNAGQITDQKDKDLWNKYSDFKVLLKMKDKVAKNDIKAKLLVLNTKYVYETALEVNKG